jgi:hypothetical protein
MPINSLLYRAYKELANGFKAKGRPRGLCREGIKDTLQQHRLTMEDATKPARARIIKILVHRRNRKQQPQTSMVNE